MSIWVDSRPEWDRFLLHVARVDGHSGLIRAKVCMRPVSISNEGPSPFSNHWLSGSGSIKSGFHETHWNAEMNARVKR